VLRERGSSMMDVGPRSTGRGRVDIQHCTFAACWCGCDEWFSEVLDVSNNLSCRRSFYFKYERDNPMSYTLKYRASSLLLCRPRRFVRRIPDLVFCGFSIERTPGACGYSTNRPAAEDTCRRVEPGHLVTLINFLLGRAVRLSF
jgi:hypothetical protein